MSSGSRKRTMGDDSPSAMDNDVKIRKEDEQLLHETEPFDCIDDVILKIRRAMEGSVGQMIGAFQQILEKLGKSDILVRKKQGQDIAPDMELRFLYKEDVTKLRKLIEEYGAKAGKVEFEAQLKKMESDDRLVRKQKNHRENSNRESENVGIPQQLETSPQELSPSQAIEQPADAVEEENQVIASKPNAHNIHTSLGGFTSSGVTDKPPQLSNCLMIIAESNFTEEFYKMMGQLSKVWYRDIVQVRRMLEQRTELMENAQYEYSLANQQQFIQEILTKLRNIEQETMLRFRNTSWVLEHMDIFETLGDLLESSDQNPSMCPFAKCLPDFRLLKCIANDSDNVAAKHILRSRKLRLRHISFEYKLGGLVKLHLTDSTSKDNRSCIVDYGYRSFQYETVTNKVDAAHLLGLFNIILQFYDVSRASISLNGFISGFYYPLLESTFGKPPSDENGKIRLKEISMESREMEHLLRWFRPLKVVINFDPAVFIVDPSLIAGVYVIEFRNVNVDQFMENSKAKAFEIVIGDKSTWSDASIVRVLTAHRLSPHNGCSRKITYRCSRMSTKLPSSWKEFFETWLHDFEAQHGKIGRKVQLEEKDDLVTFTLH